MADVKEAREILQALGMPPAQHNQMAGMTLIALCGLTPNSAWSTAKRRRCTVTKGIMDYLKEHYGTQYAPNSRETFRRQVLHQFVQGGIAEYNPFNPSLPTNSPKAHYAVTESLLRVVRSYKTKDWDSAAKAFRQKHVATIDQYLDSTDRDRYMIPVRGPDGREFRLSPGKHNKVQRAIVEDFAPRFVPGAHLLYLGDAAKKDLIVDEVGLANLGVRISDHDKLPDVIFYDADRNWLILVEAVTSHGPVSPTRRMDLGKMVAACPARPLYVSAFPDFAEFRRHMKNIAWETEVWLCEAPDHIIHYDGERFFGPEE